MKYIKLAALLTGFWAFGFGVIDKEEVEVITDQLGKVNESISEGMPVKFTYQPLIGEKHKVFLTGDFNNWSESETLMKEINGIYETTIYLKKENTLINLLLMDNG